MVVRRFERLYNSKASKPHSCCLGWLSDVSSDCTTAKQTPFVCLGWLSDVSSYCTTAKGANTIPVVWDGCQTFRATVQQQREQTPFLLSGMVVRRFERLYNSKGSKHHSCCLGWLSDVSSYCTRRNTQALLSGVVSSDCGKVTQASVIASAGCQK